MNSRIDDLRRRLDDINSTQGRIGFTADLTPLQAQIRALKKHLANAGSSAGAPPDRVRQAVAAFASTGRLTDARAARLACWGTLVLWDREEPILIEDDKRFPGLLEQVDRFRSEPRAFRRCWRGLLDAYFSYDPEKGAGDNWPQLRSYLESTCSDLSSPGVMPAWAEAAIQHRNVLSDDPCSRYGEALLADETGEVDQLCQDLGITGASWFRRRLVEAQVTAAIELGDRSFKAVLPATIELLRKNPICGDVGLARLLDRYVQCTLLEAHPELRDFSVERWKNPWLQLNDTKWASVSPRAREMVADWLKLDFIEKFFSLLSNDNLNDKRRLEFWRSYHKSIDDMYFALGPTATQSSSVDFKELRQRMMGRLRNLEKAGSPNNNAFIMHIGDYIFVEFGEKGNALYIFDGNRPPFDLSKSWISGNYTALKHDDHLDRIIHRDSDWQSWEEKVENKILQLTGLRPGDQRKAQRGQAHRERPQTDQSQDQSDVFSFLRDRRLKFRDNRSKGGALWVEHRSGNDQIARLLQLRGFQWHAGKSEWWRDH